MPKQVDFSAELILVCDSLDAGGIERVVSTLANEWSRQGRKVAVVTMHDRRSFFKLDPAVHHVIVGRAGLTRISETLKKLMARLRDLQRTKPWFLSILGGPLYHLCWERIYPIGFRLYLAYQAWALRRVLGCLEAPVVVSFGTSVNIMTLKACRGTERRVIISERNDPVRLLRIKMLDTMSRRLYCEADLVTANTRSALESMGEFVDARQMAFVPNPLVMLKGNLDGNGNGTAQGRSAVSPFVLTVGRLVEDKAHDVLLDAFARMGDDLKGWRLAIIGDGLLRETLRAQAGGLGIAGRVDWHGIVGDPHAFYRTAHVFALPSRVEGMPNVLLEAMSYGLPVVVSDGAPGPLELVEDGVTGLVVPVNDAAALAAALHRLASDGLLRRRLGEAARARVSEYELPRALAAWESVLGLEALRREECTST